MMHKKIEIDLHIGSGEKLDIEDLKKKVIELLNENLKTRNIAFEVDERNATLDDERYSRFSPSIPKPFFDKPLKPLEVGDTPETWQNQPTCVEGRREAEGFATLLSYKDERKDG